MLSLRRLYGMFGAAIMIYPTSHRTRVRFPVRSFRQVRVSPGRETSVAATHSELSHGGMEVGPAIGGVVPRRHGGASHGGMEVGPSDGPNDQGRNVAFVVRQASYRYLDE